MRHIRKRFVLRMARWGILPAVLVAALLLGMQSPAQAIGLKLTDVGGSVTKICDSGGVSDPGCIFGVGMVTFIGSVGSFTDVATTFSFPLIGSPTKAQLDVTNGSVASSAGTLKITGSQTSFSGDGVKGFAFDVGGSLAPDGSTATFNAYADGTNTLFGTANLFGTLGPFSTASFSGSGSFSTAATLTPYSLSLEGVLVYTGAGISSYDAHLTQVTPEPTGVLLMGTALLSLFGLRRRSPQLV